MRLIIVLSTLTALGALLTFIFTQLKKQTQKTTPTSKEEHKSSSLKQTHDPSLKQDKTNAADERHSELQHEYNQMQVGKDHEQKEVASLTPVAQKLLDLGNKMTDTPLKEVECQLSTTSIVTEMSNKDPMSKSTMPTEAGNSRCASAANTELVTNTEFQHTPLCEGAQKVKNNLSYDDNFQCNLNENANKIQYTVSKLSGELFESSVESANSDTDKALNNYHQQPTDEFQQNHSDQTTTYPKAVETQQQDIDWLKQLERVFGVTLVNTESIEPTPRPNTEEISGPDKSRAARRVSRQMSVSSQSALCPIRETDEKEEDELAASQNIRALREDGSLSPTSDDISDVFLDDQEDVDNQLIDLQDDPDYKDIVSNLQNPNEIQNTSMLAQNICKKPHCSDYTVPNDLIEEQIQLQDDSATDNLTCKIVSSAVYVYSEDLTKAILTDALNSYLDQKCK